MLRQISCAGAVTPKKGAAGQLCCAHLSAVWAYWAQNCPPAKSLHAQLTPSAGKRAAVTCLIVSLTQVVLSLCKSTQHSLDNFLTCVSGGSLLFLTSWFTA